MNNKDKCAAYDNTESDSGFVNDLSYQEFVNYNWDGKVSIAQLGKVGVKTFSTYSAKLPWLSLF